MASPARPPSFDRFSTLGPDTPDPDTSYFGANSWVGYLGQECLDDPSCDAKMDNPRDAILNGLGT